MQYSNMLMLISKSVFKARRASPNIFNIIMTRLRKHKTDKYINLYATTVQDTGLHAHQIWCASTLALSNT